MSVQLCELHDPKFDSIEVMAPDLNVDRIWLWRAADAENRIDLSLKQMRELRDVLNELLGRM